jgi:hypothetical protein
MIHIFLFLFYATHSVIRFLYFYSRFIFRNFRKDVLRINVRVVNYNTKIKINRNFQQRRQYSSVNEKDNPGKVILSDNDTANVDDREKLNVKVNPLTDFIFVFRDRLFSFFSKFPLFIKLWDSRFLFSDAFLISTLCLIIFKFLSFLFLGHYPIIFINIFFLFFFAFFAYKYSLMIKFKTLIVEYIYCNFRLISPLTLCWYMEDDEEMESVLAYYPELANKGYFIDKTRLQLFVENFFYFLILLRLFVLSERFFYLIARFFFVYFLLFNHYYTLVAIIGIIGVLSRVQFYMSDWNREEMRKTYNGMSRGNGHMLENYDQNNVDNNDPIIIAPTWNNSKIMYYITIRHIAKYFAWTDCVKRDRLPITREDIMEEWNHFLKKPSSPFRWGDYGFQQGVLYNQILVEHFFLEKVVTTLPYRNFLFLSLSYISILIGITYGILDEDVINLVTEIIIIPAKKVLSQVQESLKLTYKYRPLSQEFPQASIHFSPSTVGNLALDIPRKLIKIVTKGPLYRNEEGSNNDLRKQLSHPTTVGFFSDGSIFTQAQGTIKFNTSSFLYQLEPHSYNKYTQTFYGINPIAIIYNPQHPEYEALRNHIYEKSTDWGDQTHALMLTEGKIGVKGIYVPGELELQFSNIAKEFIKSSPAASLPVEIRAKFYAVLRGEIQELPGLKFLCENLRGNHNAPSNIQNSCNDILELLEEMKFPDNSLHNVELSEEGLSSFTFNDISPISSSTNEMTLVDKKGISGGFVKGFIASDKAFIKYNSGEPIPLISCTEKGEVKNEIIIKRNDHEYSVEKERVKTINLGVRGIKVPGAEIVERKSETPKIAKKEEID